PIPAAIKEEIGDRVFGCDVCQEVCPWNKPLAGIGTRDSGLEHDAGVDSRPLLPSRAQWLEMRRGEGKRDWGATALNRAGGRGVQRNAAVSAGATGDASCAAPLTAAARASDRGLADGARWALRVLSPRSEASSSKP